MKKKYLFKRLGSLLLVGLMAVSSPATALASTGNMEVSPAEIEEDIEITEGIADEVATEDTVVDDEILLTEGEDETPADETGDTDDTAALEEAKAAASQYIYDHFVADTADKRVISNGGTGIEHDGTTYKVGLKTNGTGSAITTISFFGVTASSTGYLGGWFIESDDYITAKSTPRSQSRLPITRPAGTTEADGHSFTATLKLYAADTDTDTIDNDTAEPLATQDFTIIILPDPSLVEESSYDVSFRVVDATNKNEISGASLSVYKTYDWLDAVTASNGVYTLDKDTTYKYTAKADGYSPLSDVSFTPTTSGIVDIELSPLSYSNVTFDVKDTSGNAIPNATVSVKQGYYTTISAQDDGSYRLTDNTAYSYTVTAPDYKSVSGNITPTGDQTLEVTMQADISEYTVTFDVKAAGTETTVENATIQVTYEEENDYSDDTETVTLAANEDGTYTMKKGVSYSYTISADQYETAAGSYTTSGDSKTITVSVSLAAVEIDEADQAKVDALAAQYNSEFGALRPDYATDKNINEFVLARLKAYTDLDSDGITVSLKSSGDNDAIAADGTISYTRDSLGKYSYVNNVSCEFTIGCNGATADLKSRSVTIGWDRDYFKTNMQSEADTLSWDTIKGSNESSSEVTTNLTLPQCMGTSSMQVWSSISWTSSDTSIINIESTGYDSLVDPKNAVVTAPQEDTVVTLTATFSANDRLLNSYVESVSSFGTITKTFTVTVKKAETPAPTEEELLAILDQYYTADQLTDFTTKEVIDTSAVISDIQLPRYTRIQDAEGNNIFVNREITVTSDNTDLMKISGYHVVVDCFTSDLDVEANLIVTFTREGVTVEKKIPITVKSLLLADEVLDKEIAMMDQAAAHYFDGINDGTNPDKDNITENLHAFQEMYLDTEGNIVWAYDVNDATGEGIIADSMFDDPWAMEGAGYNRFKSSNNAVIQHENLQVVRKETDTEITISSVLSSAKYGKYAASHPDNEKLQKLYRIPVSVTVTVKGTKSLDEQLQDTIAEAEALAETMIEGTDAGLYAPGSKAALEEAIETAKAVLANTEADDATKAEAVKALQSAFETASDAQNVQTAEITLVVSKESNKLGESQTIKVSADTAATYGYTKPDATAKQVTALDALAAYHAAAYEDFADNPKAYLESSNGFVSRVFGIETWNLGFFINDQLPGNATWTDATLTTGDKLTVFLYGDTTTYTDSYLYYELPKEAYDNTEVSFSVKSRFAMSGTDGAIPEKAEIALTNKETGEKIVGFVDANGVVTVVPTSAGIYDIAVQSMDDNDDIEFYIDPGASLTVTHGYGEWKTVSEATVFAAEQQERTCACGESETRTVGKKLKPTIKLTATSFPLKVKQTTTKLKVSGLANGDSVVSWKSSNTKIVKVTKKGKVTAGKKTGKATLTVTLASGLKKKVKVTVQKNAVKTTKITGLSSKISLKKGKKKTLKPVIKPFTSKQTVTYTSSNKKIVTVSKKGVIKGIKAGKATITVKSGKKQFKIKVTVK